LGRKVGESNWRFIGGHADPRSESFEADAKREATEETNLDINSLKYLGSRVVDDWRWRKVPDKIKTLFFVGWTNFCHPNADDDMNELSWFKFNGPFPPVVAEHVPLLDMLLDYYEEYKHEI
jgi:bifunctional NMN adenylyltransferase/nudix hydrolase